MKNPRLKEPIFANGDDANTFYKRKAGAHPHKLSKRNKTRNKQGKIEKILKEY